MFYFGSLGRGAATRHSDLDISVVVPDSMAEPFEEKLVPLLRLFGEIHWLLLPAGHGLVGPNWNQVDSEFLRRSELVPSHRYAGAIVHVASLVYQLLGRLRGRRTYGNRYVEALLTPEEQALYAATWPREHTQAENRRAARALWAWAEYVWREAERVIGAPLEVEVDAESMFAAIDRLYE